MISRRTPRFDDTKQGRTPEHSPTNMFISRTHRGSQTPKSCRRIPRSEPKPAPASSWTAAPDATAEECRPRLRNGNGATLIGGVDLPPVGVQIDPRSATLIIACVCDPAITLV